ncbi:hypothetical protein IFM89_005908, partial [Coptis chinensis]
VLGGTTQPIEGRTCFQLKEWMFGQRWVAYNILQVWTVEYGYGCSVSPAGLLKWNWIC